jgi:hypothetical protein
MSALIQPETILKMVRDKVYGRRAALLGADVNPQIMNSSGRGASFDARAWNSLGEEEKAGPKKLQFTFSIPENEGGDVGGEVEEGLRGRDG